MTEEKIKVGEEITENNVDGYIGRNGFVDLVIVPFSNGKHERAKKSFIDHFIKAKEEQTGYGLNIIRISSKKYRELVAELKDYSVFYELEKDGTENKNGEE